MLPLRFCQVLQGCLFEIRIKIQVGTRVLLGESGNFGVTGQLPLLLEPRLDGLTSEGRSGAPDTLRLGAKSCVKFGGKGYMEILHRLITLL